MYREAGANDVGTDHRSWRDLVLRIRAVQMELKRSDPRRSVGLAGNPAAPESALVVAELRLGRKLPPSYREFLAFCDGWPNFFEGASLLGTSDIGRRSYEAAAARMVPARCLLPFGIDGSGACLFAFDTSVRLMDGELPVVAWVGGLGIDCRCFTGFLATLLQLCRAELAQCKASALPRDADEIAEMAENSGLPRAGGSRHERTRASERGLAVGPAESSWSARTLAASGARHR